MFLKDDPAPSERSAAIPELLEDYRAQHVKLVTQAREFERLRERVRSTAEREAAAIVTGARRDVRQVLMNARNELLVLVAQLQAVGCDAQDPHADGRVVQHGATTSTAVEPPDAGVSDAVAVTDDIVSGARREVREVFLEARSELIALAGEARELRSRLASQSSQPERPRKLEGTEVFPSEAAPAQVEPAPPDYRELPSPPRLWIALAAGAAFAAIALFVWLSVPSRRPAAPQSASAPAAVDGPAPTPAAEIERAAVPVAGVALSLDVRRPAWIRTTLDGRADSGRLYAPGETRTVTARQSILIRAGDAGAVLVSVNGEPARPLGADGRVVTRRFGALGSNPTPLPAEALARAAEPRPTPAADSEPLPSRSIEPVASAETIGPIGTAGDASDAEREILRLTHRWFEAYFAGNQRGMAEAAAPEFTITDQRSPTQRMPAGVSDARRSMEQVRIEVAGDGAVVSARLTESATVDGQARQYVSLVSELFMRRDGQWLLMSVRFADAANPAMVPR